MYVTSIHIPIRLRKTPIDILHKHNHTLPVFYHYFLPIYHTKAYHNRQHFTFLPSDLFNKNNPSVRTLRTNRWIIQYNHICPLQKDYSTDFRDSIISIFLKCTYMIRLTTTEKTAVSRAQIR